MSINASSDRVTVIMKTICELFLVCTDRRSHERYVCLFIPVLSVCLRKVIYVKILLALFVWLGKREYFCSQEELVFR